MLSFAALLQVALLASCGTSNNKNTKSNTDGPQTTKISYELSGLTKAEDGSYKGKVGATVTVTAKADGPKAEEAKWTKCSSKISSGGTSNLALITAKDMSISQEWEVTFDKAITIEQTFGPAVNQTINGVPTFEGKKTFKIIIE